MNQPTGAPEPALPPLVELLQREFTGTALECLLGLGDIRVPPAIWEQALLGPARAFLSRPGKAFRARLVRTAWDLAGGGGAPPPTLPLLVELLHAGSLIVDDIEDGSTHRRGAPALHQTHGIPLALNTGNWLYFAPMALLARMGLSDELELALTRRTISTLLRCHQGQALDLAIRVGDLQQKELPDLVLASTRLKTGVLTEYAAHLGAIASGAPEPTVAALGRFGLELGLGLQMLDDLGNLVSDRTGPKQYEDLRLGRPTWPWAWLAMDLSSAPFRALVSQSREVVQGQREAAELATAMRLALGRRGRDRARRHLDGALSRLGESIGACEALDALSEEIGRMEASYV